MKKVVKYFLPRNYKITLNQFGFDFYNYNTPATGLDYPSKILRDSPLPETKEFVSKKENEIKEQTKYTPKKITTEEEHFHPKLLKLKVNQTKITAYLEDKREISLPVDELAKK
ncbi:2688_t:CDS:2 [Scutellospora calospora]|uniref:2688_t:CDS:1 n=1 Tax=Scutellospora calospora TaxID=85575 RepID=A0ACA9KGK4_9GLOM|nr:2688_t:CDS:2 [Scutellospora calospora]